MENPPFPLYSVTPAWPQSYACTCTFLSITDNISTVQRQILTFPIARSALSKNRIIPKKRKNTPKPVSPMPISVRTHNHKYQLM